MGRRIINLLILFVVFGSIVMLTDNCRNGKEKTEDIWASIEDSLKGTGAKPIDPGTIQDIIENISSPVEVAATIKSLGVPFSNKYLAPTDVIEKYNTSFDKAFNLGVYGADLGYLNMYSRTTQVLDYITVIKDLADGINVGQFFDFTTLKRLARSNTNLDSLMYISVHSFNEMDTYLRENKRSNLSVLIIAGVWIEGMYLATQVAKESTHPDLTEKIGEQKIILDKLILILENYKKDPKFVNLINNFNEIFKLYEEVEILIKPGEVETVEKDGMLTIIQNEESIVEITQEQLNSIINKTEQIRNKLIKM